MKLIRFILLLVLLLGLPMGMLYTLWSNPVSAGEDDVIYYFPLRKLVGQSLQRGCLPLYNPLEAMGQPLMADPQAAVMYPPTWLFATMEPKLAYSLSIFLAFSLAGGGAYLYLRRLGAAGMAAAIGAVAFMFCGFMVGHRVHLSVIHTACWLPWGLWCIEGLRRCRPIGPALWFVPVAFLAITGGHWPTLIHVGLIWAVYLLLRGRPFLRSAGMAAAALLLAAAIAWPQVSLTADLLAHATRQRIGLAMAGENSFFPPAAALALFPLIMGSRTPGFYPQQWWGPWHLCEMLGYVGLMTLVLAGAAVWRLRRRPAEAGPLSAEQTHWREVVRKWTWLAVGAGVFMLGYYLPTYWLIHKIPVLGVMRCPARMVLAVDMALATLAAAAVHGISKKPDGDTWPGRLGKTVRRGAIIVLPLAMLATWAAVAMGGWALLDVWPEQILFLEGGARDVLRAVNPGNPAVWVPLALAIVTGLAVRYWLKRPRRRVAVVLAVLVVDLLTVTRFVDVPPASYSAMDPETSPAATWLKANTPQDQPYRVWGLGSDYHSRADELLLAKTCESMGFATISNYGPFQSPAHAHLLSFRIFGTNRDWARLIRTNYLPSLYGVRYILAAEPQQKELIESVRVVAASPAELGPDLLSKDWTLFRAETTKDGTVELVTPFMWSMAEATQPVTLESGAIYRISLDVRGPDGGAANFLRADVLQEFADGSYLQPDEWALMAEAEQIGPDWRHFEWTFRMGEQTAQRTLFRLTTMSERPIEVRNVELRRSDWPRPLGVMGRLADGEAVYRKLVELPARRAGEPPVAIYENRLALPVLSGDQLSQPAPELLESLKWPSGNKLELPLPPPNLAIPPTGGPTMRSAALTLGLTAAWAAACVVAGLAAIRRRWRGEKLLG